MKKYLELIESTHLAITENLGDDLFPPGRRVQMQVAYCMLVIEHYSAISNLIHSNMYSSAYVLVRPTYEALTKGLWLFHCATDEQLESHASGKELADIRFITKSLLSSDFPKAISQSLHEVKLTYWKTLSSLTHVGHSQIKYWLNPYGVGPNYSDQSLLEVSNFVSYMVIVAARELALRSGNLKGAEILYNMLPKESEA